MAQNTSSAASSAFNTEGEKMVTTGLDTPSADEGEAALCPKLSLPRWHKWLIVNIICMAIVCVTCTSSIHASTYDQLEAEFNASPIILNLGLSVFVFGIGLGPTVTAPLSEHFGRRPLYLVTWVLFILFLLPSTFATEMRTLIVTRFFDGLCGGTFLAVAGGTVGDVFLSNEIQLPMSLVSLAAFVGPCIGPLVGGFINYAANWRWTYRAMIIWAGILLVLIIFFLPETRMKSSSKHDKEHHPNASHSVGKLLLRPALFLVHEPICLLLNIYSALLLGILYLFFVAFPMVLKAEYGMELWQTGVAFLGVVVGMCLATTTNPIWANVRARLTKANGSNEPEFCLPPAILGALFVPTGLFWFGWSANQNVHWISPVIGSAFYGAGTVLVFSGIFTFLVDAYAEFAASAMASNGVTRSSLASTFPLFGAYMYESLSHHWATSILAFSTVAMIPLPWIFFRYGKAIRRKSRFASVNSEKPPTV